jgi:hypothetical protein
MPCQAKQVPDDWRGIANPPETGSPFMAFGKLMDFGQSLGRKNLADSLKLARLRGVGFLIRRRWRTAESLLQQSCDEATVRNVRDGN